jgi:hypothetical protein
MPEDKKTRSKIRQERYRQAKAAGFSAKEANKMKHWGAAKLDAAIKDKERTIELEARAAAREAARIKRNERRRENYKALRAAGYTPEQARRFKSTGAERLKTLTQDFNYLKPSDTVKNYLSNYTYLIKYQTKDKDKNITEKFIYITSKTKMTRGEVMTEALEIFTDSANESMYEGAAVILSSITIVAAFSNE